MLMVLDKDAAKSAIAPESVHPAGRFATCRWLTPRMPTVRHRSCSQGGELESGNTVEQLQAIAAKKAISEAASLGRYVRHTVWRRTGI
jgi:hypothetical protein